jgi:hypothetical protein
MKRSIVLGFMLVFAPVVAVAQTTPATTTTTTAPFGRPTLTPQQQAAMQQVRAQFQQQRLEMRASLLQALTPAHRTAVANVLGQLALTANPNPRAAAQALDAFLAPAEKQSILNIAATARNNMKVLMQQQRAIFSASLTPAEQAKMAQRQAQRQAFMQSHPRTAYVPDAGSIVLRTLGTFGAEGHGGPGAMHGHLM